MVTDLIGYLQDFNVRAGGGLELKVSTTAERFEYQVVRLIHGDANPAGPGFKTETVSSIPQGSAPGGLQRIQLGSFALIPAIPELGGTPQFAVAVWVRPTKPSSDRRQTIIGLGAVNDGGSGMRLGIGLGGIPELEVACESGSPARVALGGPLRARQWSRLVATIDCERGELALAASRGPGEGADVGVRRAARRLAPLPPGPVCFAARAGGETNGTLDSGEHFNGKLGGPRMFAETIPVDEHWGADSPLPDRPIAAWHFGRAIATACIQDGGPGAHHGTLLNSPTRGVTGPMWRGDTLAFHSDPDQYDAVHFHEDDLDDARWETDAEIRLPSDLPSGIYAVRLEAGSLADYVPFFVTPGPDSPRPKIAVLLPTLTYLAYANERLTDEIDYEESSILDIPIEHDWRDEVLARHLEYGKSMYDRHTDGSGICHSTMRRPILNLRPDYTSWLTGASRHLGGDLYITDWLEARGFSYDVITDHVLHAAGDGLLEPYDVLITGSHPEYCTGRMLDAIERFTYSGSHLMYLGGNGFYWVTSIYEDRPHLAEIRRNFSGTRSWDGAPGEGYHSGSGEPGGLWRHRGRAPNLLTGVGFASQGWDGHCRGYTRTPQSDDPQVAFIFDGIEVDEVIGDFGLVMNGTSGDEIDRADSTLGTPEETLVVATSQAHSDSYQLAVEDVPITLPALGGTTEGRVRSDMTYLPRVGGGAVFSVGSVAYSGALSHDRYDNNVSRLTENVLREFLRRGGSRAANHADSGATPAVPVENIDSRSEERE